jgi:uncharacterized protein (TIGR01777 family)
MNTPRRVVIAGGWGFLGVSLAHHLAARGWEVTMLSRRARDGAAFRWSTIVWDGRTLGPWAQALDGADAIVNLAGRSVDCVKTPDHCDEILRSRVESTLVLGRALTACQRRPSVWVQMGTAHIYGDPPRELCDEDAPFGYGLAPTVGRAWEHAFAQACPADVRGVVLRTSFVIGRANAGGAGALGKLGLLARMGLGGRVGAGSQGMSWIHEADLNRLFERALTDATMRGAYIASAPHPVSQVEFMRALRRVAGGLGGLGVGLPAFSWMVRVGAPLVLRTDPELALYGRYVRSKRLEAEGFAFTFPRLEGALGDLYARAR